MGLWRKESTFTGCGDPPITIKDKQFYAACSWHDAAYSRGSWHEFNLTRARVDRAFLEQMLQIAEGNPLAVARAYIYFGVVRAFGWAWWESQ